MRVLIIEDNAAIATNLYDYLEACGYGVEVAGDGAQGFQLAAGRTFDAILLDIGLPRMDGLALCRKLKSDPGFDTSILMLTARDTLREKLAGFECGADDYLVKPFALEEVNARLIALQRRRTGQTPNRVLQVGDLHYDSNSRSVRFAGVDVKLPPKCLRLLEMLMSEPDRLFSRDDLERALWGGEQETSDRLRNHMHVLRKALVRAGKRDPIETVHGSGFRLLIVE